jgi:hypothetical protein
MGVEHGALSAPRSSTGSLRLPNNSEEPLVATT